MRQYNRLDRCTVQRRTGDFCDAPSHPDMPFPICGKHAAKLWRHISHDMKIVLNDPEYQVKAVLDFATECQEKRERQHETRPSRVYYVQVGDAIKIGTTINIRQRMNSYPPNKRLLAVEDGGYDVETKRHRQFSDLVAFGNEWFRPEPPLIKHINSLREKRGAKPIPVPKTPKKKK